MPEADDERSLPRWLVFAGLGALIVVPLVVAWTVLHDPHWIALNDLAQIEMRVRDVATAHPPALGPPGRFEAYGEIGSHPGPMAFYVLWPAYMLLGADGWALQGASLLLQAVAAGLVVWVAFRRGGTGLAVAATGALLLLIHGLGTDRMATPWNPNLPVLWWMLTLLAVWSVLVGDLVLLPVAAVAVTFCMQAHVSYGLPGVGLILLTAGWLIAHRRSDSDTGTGRRVGRWALASLGLMLALWLPPLVQQFTQDPGNMTIIVGNWRHASEESGDRISVAAATDVWLEHIDVARLARADTTEYTAEEVLHTDHGLHLGQRWPALLLLAAWIGAVTLAWRRRDSTLLRFHLVVGVAQLLGLVAITRILGPAWRYLVLGSWATTAVMLLATVWTVVTLAPAPRWDRRILAVGVAAAVGLGVLATVDAAQTEMEDITLARAVDRLAVRTDDYLADDPAGCADQCHYLVTYSDPVNIASPVFGLMLELNKRGIDAKTTRDKVSSVRDSRVMDREFASAEISMVVTDKLIAKSKKLAGWTEIAYVDPPDGHPMATFLVEPEPEVKEAAARSRGG